MPIAAVASGAAPARRLRSCRGSCGRFLAANCHLGAVLEAREAGGDDAVAGAEALRDHRHGVVLLRDLDGAHGSLVVRADDVDEGAVGAALHGGGRHHDDVVERLQEKAHVDELARPELQLAVGEVSLDADGARRLVDLVVDDLERALVEHGLAVGLQRLDCERALGARLVDLRQLLLRQREQHRYRAHLGDDDDAGVGSAHEVADVDEAHAGAAVDRRDDGGVADHGARVVDRRVVGLHLRLQLRHQRALGVDRLGRDDVGRELLVALEVAPGVGELRVVERLLGDRLVELGLVGHGIDARQHVALLDVLALLELHRQDLTVDLRAHRHGIARLRGADALQPDRDVLDLRLGCDDRHRAVRPASAAALALALLASGREVDRGRGEPTDDEHGDERFEEFFHLRILSLADPRSDARIEAIVRRQQQKRTIDPKAVAPRRARPPVRGPRTTVNAGGPPAKAREENGRCGSGGMPGQRAGWQPKPARIGVES